MNTMNLAVAILAVAASLIAPLDAQCKTVHAISMPVFYVTDRQRDGGNADPKYNCKRRYADGVEYGECQSVTPDPTSAKDFYKLGWRDQDLAGKRAVISKIKSVYMQPSEFFNALEPKVKAADGVLLFVHGYNNSMDVAIERAAELGIQFKSPVIAYCWPSNEKLLSYMKDECNAEWSLMHFRSLLKDLEARFGTDKITIVSHSMGNRLVMWALNSRAEIKKANNESAEKRFADLVLTSPDIDSGTFRNYAENVCGSATESWILISKKDRALGASKRVHGRDRLGSSTEDNIDVDWRQPPSIDSLKTVEFTAIDKGFIGHTVQSKLISRLAKNGVADQPGNPLKLKLETAGKYSWYRVSLEK